ncbi:MAG: T9SS type A sorting domain-containing protein [Saprospiraceae bacterium]|uniref:T9SS type A sorting domain-containing protein n=1 Tax=Candidatus Opimibacter skivensis TaxID=2982028 RepID=A0A9D7XMG9_9BACT|nr:T9SS type A sorting domain-containing protein [Candidatus Opimibacter skivensis]
MKNLYRLQTLLVVSFSFMFSTWINGQLGDPININLKNSGSVYTDQFAGDTIYARTTVQPPGAQFGNAQFTQGSNGNTLKVTFIPTAGAIGSTDYIVSYYTVTAPMHPVTRWYRFNLFNEVVVAGTDKYVVAKGAIDFPLQVLDNDSVPTGALTLSSVSISNAGDAVVNATGDAILFSPNADFEGDTWIQYIACDSFGNCGQGNVHVLVHDPSQQDQVYYKKYLLNTEDLDILTPFDSFAVDIEPLHGSLESTSDFGWTYTPDDGYIGKDTFQLGLSNQVLRNYAITVYNNPINYNARDDKFYVRPGLSVTFNVLNNDLLHYAVDHFTNPARGVLSEVSNGVYTYSPNTGYRGVDKFTYTACFEDTICETATVYIHVTDLEPDNVFTYKLQTTEELPLTIDYPIEYTDFSYIISQDPSHGALVYNAGLQQINLPCDTIESYNMIVYTPEVGYTGPDHFEYYYCIQPSNLCYLVKVDMDVIAAPETESCPCTVGCVWPGDADQDGRVDMSDLLTMGNKLGSSGPVRSYNDPATWFGQHAVVWSPSNESGNSTEFLDGNGDGTVTSSDVDVISEYYFKTHDVVVRDVQQKLPYQFSIVPVQFSLDSGDLVILDIVFGNAAHPVIDMKGAKFSINLPQNMADSASVTVDFHQDSWLAEGSPFISLGKVPWNGRIDAGFSRANGNGASGFGVIATTTFIIVDDVEGFKTDGDLIQIPVTLTGGTAMDEDGTMYDIDGDEVTLTYNLHDINQNKYNLLVYPNPAQDIVDVHINGKTAIKSISIIDPQGRVIRTYDDINQKHYQLDVSSLTMGVYYLQVNHNEGVISQLLSVIR